MTYFIGGKRERIVVRCQHEVIINRTRNKIIDLSTRIDAHACGMAS